jgi:hypothetical protein
MPSVNRDKVECDYGDHGKSTETIGQSIKRCMCYHFGVGADGWGADECTVDNTSGIMSTPTIQAWS